MNQEQFEKECLYLLQRVYDREMPIGTAYEIITKRFETQRSEVAGAIIHQVAESTDV